MTGGGLNLDLARHLSKLIMSQMARTLTHVLYYYQYTAHKWFLFCSLLGTAPTARGVHMKGTGACFDFQQQGRDFTHSEEFLIRKQIPL